MKITEEQLGDLHKIVHVQIEKSDYEPRVTEALNKLRKNYQIKGFRKGRVPLGLIKKMVGNSVLKEEVAKLAQEALTSYLKENNIEPLAEPILLNDTDTLFEGAEKDQYTFDFEIGVAPVISLDWLENKPELTKYVIAVDDKMVDEEIENLRKRAGTMVEVEESPQEGDEVVITIEPEGDAGDETKGKIEKSFGFDRLPEKLKTALKSLKPGEKTEVALFKIGDGEDPSIFGKYLLDIDREETIDPEKMFIITLVKVRRLKPAEVNQELFDMVFGKDEVKSEEEFRDKLKQRLEEVLDREMTVQLKNDLFHQLMEHVEIPLPENFLRKVWERMEAQKQEQVEPENKEESNKEKDFEEFLKSLRWQLIKNQIVKTEGLEVTTDEIVESSREVINNYFGGQAAAYLDESHYNSLLGNLLSNQRHVQQVTEQILTDKALDAAVGKITVVPKSVSLDEYKQLKEQEKLTV